MKENNQEEQTMLENTNIVNEEIGKLIDACPADEIDTSSEIDGQNDLSSDETESSTLQIIDKLISLYSRENLYLLEVIQPYDQLVDQIDTQKAVLSAICEDVKRANSLYDGFKRAFSQVIDNANCGEKLYYALPLYDDFDEKDEWISLWRQVTQLALAEENKDCIRVFLNKNFYNNTVSFPKDLYFFKPHPKELKNLDTNVKKNVLVFYSRLYTFYKLVKDFSESLRTSLLKSLLASPEYFNNMPKKTGLPTLEELEADKELQKQLFDSDDSSEIDFRLARYKTMSCDDEQTIENFRKQFKSNTKLVICTHASNVFGIKLPIERIGALCRLNGILFCVDAAQSAGTADINISDSCIDFLCTAGHKGLYGPMGTGLLIINSETTPDSLIQGGTGSDSANLNQPT